MNRIMIRHGESEYNARTTPSLDSSLTQLGKYQIETTGAALQTRINGKWRGIVSPYLRTLQTAQIIREFTGLDFKVALGPREIMMIYDYCKIGDHRDQFPEFDWSDYPVGGLEVFEETEPEYMGRITSFMDSIENDRVLIVSHGVPVVTMMEHLMGIHRTPTMRYYAHNGSITWVDDGRLVCYDYSMGS